jgi:hypothetical protein
MILPGFGESLAIAGTAIALTYLIYWLATTSRER